MNINKIKKHLEEYKNNVLEINENGEWWRNHRKYGHILPIEKKFENIINSKYKSNLINLIETNSIHMGFHHLNSSQALALNLFGPLVLSNNFQLIEHIQIEDNSTGKFEYIENTTENTNFDFFVSARKLNNYFEVKYTENDFGNTKSDNEHKQKFLEVYKSKLASICSITENEFYKEYQLWRNILYAKKGNVFFVLPDFRTDLIKKVNDAKAKITDLEVCNRVYILSIDSLVSRCKELDDLKDHYNEFEKKYLEII